MLMPWASRAAAVLYAWLPGQAMGEALADVLLGQAEPGGQAPGHPAGSRGGLPGAARHPAGRAAQLR